MPSLLADGAARIAILGQRYIGLVMHDTPLRRPIAVLGLFGRLVRSLTRRSDFLARDISEIGVFEILLYTRKMSQLVQKILYDEIR